MDDEDSAIGLSLGLLRVRALFVGTGDGGNYSCTSVPAYSVCIMCVLIDSATQQTSWS